MATSATVTAFAVGVLGLAASQGACGSDDGYCHEDKEYDGDGVHGLLGCCVLLPQGVGLLSGADRVVIGC